MSAYCPRPPSLRIARPRLSIGLNESSCAEGSTADQAGIESVTSVREKPISEIWWLVLLTLPSLKKGLIKGDGFYERWRRHHLVRIGSRALLDGSFPSSML